MNPENGLDEYQEPDDTTPSILLDLLQATDEDKQVAWVKITDVYMAPLFNLYIRLGLPKEAAQDCVQDTLMSLFLAMQKGNFKHDGRQLTVQNYIFSIAYKKAFDKFKELNKHCAQGGTANQEILSRMQADESQDTSSEEILASNRVDSELLDEQELRKFGLTVLIEAIEHTKRRNQDLKSWRVFEMWVIEGLSYEEIENQLGVNPNSAKQMVFKNKKRLAEHLELNGKAEIETYFSNIRSEKNNLD